jgi:chromosome segregation ATPase
MTLHPSAGRQPEADSADLKRAHDVLTGRIVDLTVRLEEATAMLQEQLAEIARLGDECAQHRRSLHALREAHEHLVRTHDALRQSRALRVVAWLRSLVRFLTPGRGSDS